MSAIDKVEQRLRLRRVQLHRAFDLETKLGFDDEITGEVDLLLGKVGGLEIYRIRLLRKFGPFNVDLPNNHSNTSRKK